MCIHHKISCTLWQVTSLCCMGYFHFEEIKTLYLVFEILQIYSLVDKFFKRNHLYFQIVKDG